MFSIDSKIIVIILWCGTGSVIYTYIIRPIVDGVVLVVLYTHIYKIRPIADDSIVDQQPPTSRDFCTLEDVCTSRFTSYKSENNKSFYRQRVLVEAAFEMLT